MKYAKKVIIADPLESALDRAIERVTKQKVSDTRKLALYQDILCRFQKQKAASSAPQSLQDVTTKQLEILERLSQILNKVEPSATPVKPRLPTPPSKHFSLIPKPVTSSKRELPATPEKTKRRVTLTSSPLPADADLETLFRSGGTPGLARFHRKIENLAERVETRSKKNSEK